MKHDFTYRIFSLGDCAVTVDFGNYIDEAINQKVISLFHFLNENPLPGMIEAVPAYSSLTVYYNAFLVKKINSFISAADFMKKKLENVLKKNVMADDIPSRNIEIPVYYNGEDLVYVASEKNLSAEELIQIHCSKEYRVFMLGFLPGFPYMGQTDERIFVQRKKQPRLKVEAGSVAIAGSQTGIYPLTSPGGWQIIGRTPLKIFDISKDNPAVLRAGDKVKFYPIDKHEFESY
jgi:inhibitor of KinA